MFFIAILLLFFEFIWSSFLFPLLFVLDRYSSFIYSIISILSMHKEVNIYEHKQKDENEEE